MIKSMMAKSSVKMIKRVEYMNESELSNIELNNTLL